MSSKITNGLILSEVLINAFKHAFPEREQGTVNIKMDEKENMIRLNISDDGIGFPEDVNLENTDSLGLELIRILVDQLDGELDLKSSSKGTQYLITFQR